jgi:hypothetical protein
VTLLTTDCSRRNFFKHGMYLNNLGKSNVLKQIVICILETTKEVPKALITLDWKSVYDRSVNYILMCEGNQKPVPIRNSNRIKKILITRSYDFLWEIQMM